MATWVWTNKEKKAVNEAYDAVRYLASTRGKEALLDACVRCERRERGCITLARWCVVREFCRGLYQNPRADEFAWCSQGLQAAVLVGASCMARYVVEFERHDRRIERTYDTANKAYDAYMQRGVASTKTGKEVTA